MQMKEHGSNPSSFKVFSKERNFEKLGVWNKFTYSLLFNPMKDKKNLCAFNLLKNK